MFNKSYANVFVISIFGLLSIHSVISSTWDYAVTTSGEILFYNQNWTLVNSAAHQFTKLSAIGFDEINEIIYFNDQLHENGSIFSLKLTTNPDTRSNNIQTNVQKVENETIQGIAFDPVEHILYWTDSTNKRIYKIAVADFNIKEPTTLITFKDEIPHGITIDYCSRTLFWTNKNDTSPSIGSLPLSDPTQSVKLITGDMFTPMGITVDQYSRRIYWVDNKDGDYYSIESAEIDGSDRKITIESLYHIPFNLAVDKTSIYWSDLTFMSIWMVKKDSNIKDNPIEIKKFPTKPQGIIYKTDYLTTLEKNNDCKHVIKDIKDKLTMVNSVNVLLKSSLLGNNATNNIPPICLFNGKLNPNTNKCVCKIGYTGEYCQTYICNNYCVEGKCDVQESNGVPKCTCNLGFSGKRCEQNLCDGFCLNHGLCFIGSDNKLPTCKCNSKYTGPHCEYIENKENICEKYCKTGISPEASWDMIKICGKCEVKHQIECMNGGLLDSVNGKCDCQLGFSGRLCEISVCDNYCFQGKCELTSTGFAECNCAEGFIGERCEINLCNGFCLNEGRCNFEKSKPVCNCTSLYYGRHCEHTTEDLCKEYCLTGTLENIHHELDIRTICGDCSINSTIMIKPPSYESPIYTKCKGMTTSVLIITSGVIISLLILLVILNVIRKMAKPLRPKVRKTYVVRKNVTPLTCRPGTEQQCEITIEDCCNMNICDTPCFDPNVLQKEARESLKDDKKKLLGNMEHNGDLY